MTYDDNSIHMILSIACVMYMSYLLRKKTKNKYKKLVHKKKNSTDLNRIPECLSKKMVITSRDSLCVGSVANGECIDIGLDVCWTSAEKAGVILSIKSQLMDTREPSQTGTNLPSKYTAGKLDGTIRPARDI